MFSFGALLCLIHLPLLLSRPGQVEFDYLHVMGGSDAVKSQELLQEMWLENTASGEDNFVSKQMGKMGLDEFPVAIPVLDMQKGGLLQRDAMRYGTHLANGEG